ncbi:MAG TPA: trimethylamine methyltransferase family protein, partial [Anaerolineales bacterium]|nr:trimethylamine methyltransferase family protein [Anaerolineales bacterium]
MSHKKIKTISDPKLKLDILSKEDVQKIHEATLHIIENVGIRFPSKRALRIWEEAGATVDHEKKIVKVKPYLIEDALKQAPPAYTLGARDPQQNLSLDGNHVHLGTDGCGVEIIDIHTGMKRTTELQDVCDIARIADATEEVAFHWVPVSAQDAPVEARGLHELKAVWENSTKHVQTESIYNVEEAKASMEMAILLAGSKEDLRKRPVLSLMQCTAPPLGHDGGSLDAALIAAEHGVPTGFMTMTACM